MSDEMSAFKILEDELDGWLSADELRTLRKNDAKGGTLADFSTALKKAHRQNLDPLQDHVFFLSNYDKEKGRDVLSLGVSIAGLRAIAQSTGEYAGQKGYFWCGPDGEWTDVWLKDEPPAAAKVGVLRQSFKEPLWNVARWDDYAPLDKHGDPRFMWAVMGPHMLGKCCEANALRRAFPDRTSELYIPEEMEKEGTATQKANEVDEQVQRINAALSDDEDSSHGGPNDQPATNGSTSTEAESAPETDDRSETANGTDKNESGEPGELGELREAMERYEEKGVDMQDAVAAISIHISEWPKEKWEAGVEIMEEYYDDAWEECDLRRTPEELRE